jgi:hypothetical protein
MKVSYWQGKPLNGASPLNRNVDSNGMAGGDQIFAMIRLTSRAAALPKPTSLTQRRQRPPDQSSLISRWSRLATCVQRSADLFPAAHELGAIPPPRVRRVGQSHFLCVCSTNRRVTASAVAIPVDRYQSPSQPNNAHGQRSMIR